MMGFGLGGRDLSVASPIYRGGAQTRKGRDGTNESTRIEGKKEKEREREKETERSWEKKETNAYRAR